MVAQATRPGDGGSEDPFGFIPRGGGDHLTGHRCPGEWILIEVMERAFGLLASTDDRVSDQDLEIDFRRLPALPKSGFRSTVSRPLAEGKDGH